MGASYSNYTLMGPSQSDVAGALAGRDAFVLPPHRGAVVVLDRGTEVLGEDMDAPGMKWSEQLRCPILWVMVHDDDVMYYRLFQSGKLVDAYDSYPGFGDMFDEARPVPDGGDIDVLCQSFPQADRTALETVLRSVHGADDEFLFESHRHGKLIDALRLSSYAQGLGYEYFMLDDSPTEFERSAVISTKA